MLDNMQTKNLGLLYHKLNMIHLRRKLTEVERELAHQVWYELSLRGYDDGDFTQEMTDEEFREFLIKFMNSPFSKRGSKW